MPSGDGAESDVVALEVVGIFAGIFSLFEGGEVETGPIIGSLDGGIDDLVEIAQHFRRVGFLADEFEGKLLVGRCEEEGAEDDFLIRRIKRGGVEISKGNSGEGIEASVCKVVVELVVVAVLKVDGRGIVENDGEFDPADFGLAEAGEDRIGAKGVVGESDGVSPG